MGITQRSLKSPLLTSVAVHFFLGLLLVLGMRQNVGVTRLAPVLIELVAAPARSLRLPARPKQNRKPAAQQVVASAPAPIAIPKPEVVSAPTQGAPEAPSDRIYAEGELDHGATLRGRPEAVYPPRARALGLEGKVLVKLVINAEGEVRDAQVLKAAGNGFDEAALDAARKLRFTPALKEGKAVLAYATWLCSFRLD